MNRRSFLSRAGKIGAAIGVGAMLPKIEPSVEVQACDGFKAAEFQAVQFGKIAVARSLNSGCWVRKHNQWHAVQVV